MPQILIGNETTTIIKVKFVDGQLEYIIHLNKNGDKVRVEAEMVTTNPCNHYSLHPP